MGQKKKFVSLADLQQQNQPQTQEANSSKGVVYSTERGRTCPECGAPESQCQCRTPSQYPAAACVLIKRETKGRKGKGVTLVEGIGGSMEDLQTLASELKRHCGCGGAVKDGTLEIQGDVRTKVLQFLSAKGRKAKISGG